MSRSKAKPKKPIAKKTSNPKSKQASKSSVPDASVVAQEVSILEREDLLILKLSYSELQNKQLQLQNAQREVNEAQANWAGHLDVVNQKYDLNPIKDKLNLQTGAIQKG